MLEIDVVTAESYDEERRTFVVDASYRVQLEHSLVSASKWEARWEKAFLGREEKTPEETLSYVRMMILNDNVPPGVFKELVEKYLDKVQAYIGAPMTATKLRNDPTAAQSRETITTELIYYWMISLNVPVEFQHWHLNRLIMLIRVINLKNSPKKKMSAAERKALNRQRLSKYKTRG